MNRVTTLLLLVVLDMVMDCCITLYDAKLVAGDFASGVSGRKERNCKNPN